jgi:hypothetical protein
MTISIYYDDGYVQRIQGDILTFFLACAASSSLPWKAARRAIGVALLARDGQCIQLAPIDYTHADTSVVLEQEEVTRDPVLVP